MSREVIVGLVVKLDGSKATVGLRDVGEEGKKTGEKTEKSAKKSESAFKGMKETIRTVADAMRIVHGMAVLFQAAIGATIGKSLEWRGAQDNVSQAFHRFQNVLGTTQARIGDQFMPLLHGLADAASPMLKQLQTWIRLNSTLIASTIIQWTVQLATALVQGVAFGLLQVARAYYGWKAAILVVESLWGEAVSGIMGGISLILAGTREMLQALGKDDWAAKVEKGRKIIEGVGKESEKVSDQALADAAAEIRALDEKEKMLERVKDILVKGIGQAGVAAFSHLKDAIRSSTRSAEELDALTTRILSVYEARSQADKAYRDAIVSRDESEFARLQGLEQKKAAEILKWNDGTVKGTERMWQAFESRRASLGKEATEQIYEEFDKINEEKMKKMAEDVAGYFNQVVDIGKSAFADIGKQADGTTKTVGDGFKQLFGDLAKMIADSTAKWLIAKGIEKAAEKASAIFTIQSHAAGAAAGAAESQAAIPVIGPALAIAAAIAMFAAVTAFAGKFHSGGLVGGTGDRMILAQSGELVVDRAKTPAALAAGFGPGDSPRMGGGDRYTTVQISLLAPPDRTDWNRVDRDVVQPSTNLMGRLGAQPYGRYGGG